jgi:hypothetical protein
MPCISFATYGVVQGLIFRYRIFSTRARSDGRAEILGADAKNVNANVWQSLPKREKNSALEGPR